MEATAGDGADVGLEDEGQYPAELQVLRFPNGLADEAVAVCQEIASTLFEHLRARTDQAAESVDEPGHLRAGPARDDFEEMQSGQDTGFTMLIEDLNGLAGGLLDDMDAVSSENDRRELARESYVPRPALPRVRPPL